MTIREATLDDIPRIVELARHFLQATPYGALLDARPEVITQTATLLVEGHGVILVVDMDVGQGDGARQEVVGFLALYVGPHPFSGAIVGDELAWWMEPAHRRGRTGYYLLRAGEAWARQHAVSVLKVVSPAASAPGLGTLYERLGYVLVESVYQKTIEA